MRQDNRLLGWAARAGAKRPVCKGLELCGQRRTRWRTFGSRRGTIRLHESQRLRNRQLGGGTHDAIEGVPDHDGIPAGIGRADRIQRKRCISSSGDALPVESPLVIQWFLSTRYDAECSGCAKLSGSVRWLNINDNAARSNGRTLAENTGNLPTEGVL